MHPCKRYLTRRVWRNKEDFSSLLISRESKVFFAGVLFVFIWVFAFLWPKIVIGAVPLLAGLGLKHETYIRKSYITLLEKRVLDR